MAKLFDEQFWDERYGSSPAVWSGEPNPQLVAELSQLDSGLHAGEDHSAAGPHGGTTAGMALDVGCGEGADAVWLARRGWDVTAVDISRVALERAAAHVADMDLAGSIVWEHHDLLQWAPPASTFDLVSAQFMHLPAEDREPLFARLAEAVGPGGTLLIVGHSEQDVRAGARRPHGSELYFTAAQLALTLEAALPVESSLWRVEIAETRPRAARDPEGRHITIHDEVLRATRRR